MARFNFHHVNLIYIRAAIERATGIRLKLPELCQYLIEEDLATPAQLNSLIFHSRGTFFEGVRTEYQSVDPISVDIVVNSNVIRDPRTGRSPVVNHKYIEAVKRKK